MVLLMTKSKSNSAPQAPLISTEKRDEFFTHSQALKNASALLDDVLSTLGDVSRCDVYDAIRDISSAAQNLNHLLLGEYE